MILDVAFRAHQLPLPVNGFGFKPIVGAWIASADARRNSPGRAPAGSRPGRVEVLLDTGCERSLFAWTELEARGVPRAATAGPPHPFRSASGTEFAGIPVRVSLQVESLPAVQMTVYATDHPIDHNFLGVDFLATRSSAFDLGIGYAYLADTGVPPSLQEAADEDGS